MHSNIIYSMPKPIFTIDPDEVNDSYQENMKKTMSVKDIINEKIFNPTIKSIFLAVAKNCSIFANKTYLLNIIKQKPYSSHAARAFITPQNPTVYGDNYIYVNNTYVVKVINYQDNPEAEFDIINEIAMQLYANTLKHTCDINVPNIVNYGKVCLSDTEKIHNSFNHNCFFYFTMNKIDDMSLDKFAKTVSPDICEPVVKKANEVNQCLIEHGLYHNDYHAQNVLADEQGDITILDFGNATDHITDFDDKNTLNIKCGNKGGRKSRGKKYKRKTKRRLRTRRL